MTRKALSNLKKEQCQNPALLLQQYAGEINDSNGEKKPEAIAALLTAVADSGKDSGLAGLYRIAFERWTGGFSGDGHCAMELGTLGYLRIGAGSDNALEFSLRLHPLYGVPITPGSAIKGLASHYCHKVWGDGDARFKRGGEFHKLIFGATDEGGVIIFHDAWITPDSLDAGALVRDIMTPHHQEWQVKGVGPTDFDSPIPVNCLSVSGSFRFAISWSSPTVEGAENRKRWLALVGELIKEAVSNWGIGGKASSGYGRMAEGGGAGVMVAGGIDRPAEAPVSAAGKRTAGTPVQVKFLGPREAGKKGFRAQEEGKAEGSLSVDEPPGPLPEIGGIFTAYIKDDAKPPQ
ncbi:MAG: type III-B CRISPR module RAMP protein Cmr6 [Phycisphaerae bacterium]